MGNVRMRAEQINYGAGNVKVALDTLDPMALIALNNRMNTIEAWKATVKAEEKTGAEVTFTNALALDAVSLSAEIEAVQDLHGYDHPWVGGAGKNKFGPNFTGVTGITPSVDSNGYLNLTVSGAVSATFLKGQSIALKANTAYTLSCAGASSDVKVSLRNSDGSTIYASVEVDGGSSTYTPTEDITVYFYIRVETSAALTATLKPQLEEGASATTFAPYSNICPISGRTAVAVDDTGLNMWDATADDTVYGWGGTWSKSGQTYTCVASSSSIQLFSENGTATQASHAVSVEPNSNYCVSVSGMIISQVFGVMYDRNKQFLRFVRQQTIVNNSAVIAVPSDAYYMGLRIDYNSATTGTTYNFKIQIEVGSTPTSYQPYAHSSATIQLGTTVYGGTLNVTTGVMTVDRLKRVLVSSDVTAVSGNQKRMNITISGVRSAASDSVADDIIQSDKFKALSSNDTYSGNIGISVNTVGGIGIAIGENLTLESAQQYVTDNAIEVVYPLATPQTIQLTPTDLQMLKGYNRLLADTGDITVEAYTGAAWGGDEA